MNKSVKDGWMRIAVFRRRSSEFRLALKHLPTEALIGLTLYEFEDEPVDLNDDERELVFDELAKRGFPCRLEDEVTGDGWGEMIPGVTRKKSDWH